MARLFLLLIGVCALLLPGAARAAYPERSARTVTTVSWVEEWDPAAGRWVRVADDAAALLDAAREPAPSSVIYRHEGGAIITETVTEEPRPGAGLAFAQSERFTAVFPPRGMRARGPGLAQYGPFTVLDSGRAALIGSTDAQSPAQFAAMLRDFPELGVLEMVEAPGTTNDLANLALGRAIRAAGLATMVPDDGSVRSGAVELFLAGTRQTIAPGASFAVHSWRDMAGREPADFSPEAPENLLYLDYYEDMGMSADAARAFYRMTNSVPHSGALWLDAETMRGWLPGAAAAEPAVRMVQGAPPAPICEGALADGFAFAVADGEQREPVPAQLPAPAASPQLAYARLALDLPGVLDSGVAFP